MKRVLIYIQENLLAPKGGPLGYNYNLYVQLKQMECTEFQFLPPQPKRELKEWRKFVPNVIKNIVHEIRKARSVSRLLSSKYPHKAQIDINQYDVIHFHDTKSLYEIRDDLSNYHGKIVLTSHSPTLPSMEIYDMLNKREKRMFGWLYKKLNSMDEYSFRKADYIFFPCEEAEEPYRNNWPQFSEIKKEKKNSFRYILTGIEKPVFKKTREEILLLYNIPKDAVVVSYVGRHNKIKGYDILKRMAERILSVYPNVYFLIAGKEEPIRGLENHRWIEVGWTDDPYSLIAASDLFVLPNRETYFDLILLEVLSIGIPVVCGATGGNKYFSHIGQKGIFLYETFNDGIQYISSLVEKTEQERNLLGAFNKVLFEKKFTNEIFARNYISLIQSL